MFPTLHRLTVSDNSPFSSVIPQNPKPSPIDPPIINRALFYLGFNHYQQKAPTVYAASAFILLYQTKIKPQTQLHQTQYCPYTI